jgi:hypothetical protein
MKGKGLDRLGMVWGELNWSGMVGIDEERVNAISRTEHDWI